MRVAERAKACVVDQKFDFDFLAGGEGVDLRGGCGLSQVGGKDFDVYVMGGFETRRGLLEAVGAARGEDQIRASCGKEFRKFKADAGTCAGDDDPLPFPAILPIL